MFMKSKKGMVGVVIALVVALIAIMAVLIPVTQSLVNSANLTGINATIASYFVTFILLGVLVLVTGLAVSKYR